MWECRASVGWSVLVEPCMYVMEGKKTNKKSQLLLHRHLSYLAIATIRQSAWHRAEVSL